MRVKRKRISSIYMSMCLIFIYVGMFLCVYSIISPSIREYKLMSSYVLCCLSGTSFFTGMREVLHGSYKGMGYVAILMGPLGLIFSIWKIISYI